MQHRLLFVLLLPSCPGVPIQVNLIRETGAGLPRLGRRTALLLAALFAAAAAGAAVAAIPDSSGVFHACADNKSGSVRLVDPAKGQVCKKSESAVSWGGTAAPSSSQLGLYWAGDWTSVQSYRAGAIARYNGVAYVALAANSNVVPTTTCPRTQCTGPTWTPLGSAAPTAPPAPSTPAVLGSVTTASFSGVPVGTVQATVREISLPAGRYFLLASIAPGTLDTDEQEATCSLAVGYGGNVTATLDTATSVVPYPHGGVTRPSPIVLQGAVYFTQPGFARLKCSLFRGLIGGKLTALQVGSISGQ